MKQYQLLIFCQEQAVVYNKFMHIGLIKDALAGYIPDPITKNDDCAVIRFKANPLIYELLTFLFDRRLSSDGLRRQENYLRYGIIDLIE